MKQFRTVFALAAILAAAAPAAAQDPLRDGLAGDVARAPALYRFLLAEDDLRSDAYAQLEDLLVEALGLSTSLEQGGTCAYLVGTGGSVSKLDGGGDFLNAVSWPFLLQGPFALASDDRVGEFGELHSLIIIDDFRAGELAVALQRLISSDREFNPPGEPYRLWSATVGFLVGLQGTSTEDTDVPHGHLVAYHALSQFPLGTRVVEVRRPHVDRVDVTLDVHGYAMKVHLLAMRFDQIATIRTALEEAETLRPAHVVLSWGLVPCILAEQYELVVAEPHATIVDFTLAALRADARLLDLARELCQEFEDAEDAEDGIVGLPEGVECADASLEDLLGLSILVWLAEHDVRAQNGLDFDFARETGNRYYAAAGNQGLAIPMPPASWQGIVGVEACAVGLDGGGPPPDLAPFSNAGGVGAFSERVRRELGGWFQTPVTRSDEGGSGESPYLGYWGTSFAAPTAALTAMASFRTQVGGTAPRCD